MHICNSRIIVIIIIMTILSKHTITGHQRPAGDTPLKWHIAGGPLVARRSMAYRWLAVCGPTMCFSWVESGQSMGPIANICNYMNYRMVCHFNLDLCLQGHISYPKSSLSSENHGHSGFLCPLRSWVSLWNFETNKGSLMRP